MTLRTNTGDGGTVGSTVTVGNSGGSSGDAFDAVSIGSGSTCVYDTDFSVSPAYEFAAGPGDCWVSWSLASVDRVAARFEVYLSAHPSALLVLAKVITTGSSSFMVWVNATGHLVTAAGGVGSLGTGTEVLPLDTWLRIELTADMTTVPGDWTLDLYADTTTTTPLESLAGSASWYPAGYPASEMRFGIVGSPGTYTLHLDNLAVDDTGTPIGPWVPPPVTLAAPPAKALASAPAPEVSDLPLIIAAPPAKAIASAPAPTLLIEIVIAAPVARAIVRAPAPHLLHASITAVSPAQGQVLPSARPTFTVTVSTEDDDAHLEVAFGTDDTFAGATILTTPIATGMSIIPVSVRATTAITEDTYWWRARVTNATDTTDWTTPISFVVSPVDGDGFIGGLWTVTATATPTPHLWFVRPSRGRAGDTAAAVGTGFGPTLVNVRIAGVDAPVTDFDTITPTADAYTADRVIDGLTGNADPGHQQVTFTVPEVPFPGGALFVEGS